MPAVEEVLDGLAGRDPGRTLDLADGRVRVDLTAGRATRHWLVELAGGRVTSVSHEHAAADAVLRGDRDALQQLVNGEATLGMAFVRGDLDLQGNLELITLLTRLLRPAEDDCRPRRAIRPQRAPRRGRP